MTKFLYPVLLIERKKSPGTKKNKNNIKKDAYFSKFFFCFLQLNILINKKKMTSTYVITGASRGLGLEFVKQLSSKGNTVFALVRNPEASEGLQKLVDNKKVFAFKLDALDESSIKVNIFFFKKNAIHISVYLTFFSICLRMQLKKLLRLHPKVLIT